MTNAMILNEGGVPLPAGQWAECAPCKQRRGRRTVVNFLRGRDNPGIWYCPFEGAERDAKELFVMEMKVAS